MALQRTHWFGVKVREVGLPQPVQRRADLRLGVTGVGSLSPGVIRGVIFLGSFEDILFEGPRMRGWWMGNRGVK